MTSSKLFPIHGEVPAEGGGWGCLAENEPFEPEGEGFR